MPSGSANVAIHPHFLSVTGSSDTFALAMTYFNGHGGQYTAAEIAGFLAAAGFEDLATAPTYAYYSLVSGTKRP